MHSLKTTDDFVDVEQTLKLETWLRLSTEWYVEICH
jgi:hypothetical protein